MSSVKACGNHAHRKSKVSYARLIRVGLVGPKLNPEGVGDGQWVNIPIPPNYCYGKGGTQEDRLSVPTGHGASPTLGISRQVNPLRCQAEGRGELRGNLR